MKFEEPLTGYKAFCLSQMQFDWMKEYLKNLRSNLLTKSDVDAWTLVMQLNNNLPDYPIPVGLLQMLPILIRQIAFKTGFHWKMNKFSLSLPIVIQQEFLTNIRVRNQMAYR